MSIYNDRREMLTEWEKDNIEKYGFYIHIVPGTTQCNYHTHGLVESFEHRDLQIVLPIDPQLAGALFHSIVNEIKNGKKFEEGVDYFGLVADPKMPTAFKKVKETGRTVLRMLIPDRNGVLPGREGCDPAFATQWIDLI
ncbi:DUF4262 domain-containing protein (plasmid) [Paenibacillus thiaminolyticus]|uniref:DUF4262 domain-containing protein n=1 Tax=Paenibacillus thiaminolyticus TaxID=49283 RepID=UPI00232FA5FC|nr:DUF4262 domain-containing protein [Paenibacillus thiaminolyticus]WCF11554.1 DUF4262 domain-containing protein [Paenibacillus thiaminolyticus]